MTSLSTPIPSTKTQRLAAHVSSCGQLLANLMLTPMRVAKKTEL